MQMLKKLIGALMALGLCLICYVGFAMAMAATNDNISSQTPHLTAVAATPQSAPVTPTPDVVAIQSAWRLWMVDYDITDSAMAIGDANAIIFSDGVKRSPSNPYPVASLSKAITAICLNTMLNANGLSWQSDLAAVAPQLSSAGISLTERTGSITFEELVTHTAGLAPDLTQGNMGRGDFTFGSLRGVARLALSDEGTTGTRGEYFYANTNYAVLGAVIEGLTGTPYGDACKTAVTIPVGASDAGVFGAMTSRSSYGGWSVSAEDYARFAMTWFAPDQPWVTDPDAFAFDPVTGYGLGVGHGWVDQQQIISHRGRWTSSNNTRHNLGAIFLISSDGTVFTANWVNSLPSDAYIDLYDAIAPYL